MIDRYLDKMESRLRHAPVTRLVEYRGKIDYDAMAHAFDLLCSSHPDLRAQICHDGRGYRIRSFSAAPPTVNLHKTSELDRLDTVLSRWDVTERTAELRVFDGDDHGYISFTTDHSIADGARHHALLAELWQAYTRLVSGADVVAGRNMRVPAAPSEVLTQRLGEPSPPETRVAVDGRESSPGRTIESIRRDVRLSSEETTALLNIARANQISVNMLVCGALAVAQAGQSEDTAPRTMRCWIPIDVRSRLRPPVPATDVTNLFNTHVAEATVAADDSPVAVGHDVRASLEAAIASGQLPLDLLQKAMKDDTTDMAFEEPAGPVLTDLGCSGLGRLSAYSVPDGLSIVDARLIAHHSSNIFPAYVPYTYASQLRIHCSFRPSIYNVRLVDDLTNAVLDILRRLS